jgi:hypothetical protein
MRRDDITYKPLREGAELYVGVGLATSVDRPDVRQFILRALGTADSAHGAGG